MVLGDGVAHSPITSKVQRSKYTGTVTDETENYREVLASSAAANKARFETTSGLW